MLLQLVELFFGLAHEDLSPRVEFFVMDILESVIEEMDAEEFTTEFLDAILRNLLQLKTTNEHTYRMAVTLITRCQQQLVS
jgi:hypothetical protein